MKRVLIASILSGVSASASADVGLGMSIQSGDPTLYVPIDIGKLRVEPFLNYNEDKFESSVFGSTSSFTVRSVQEQTSYRLGVGLFGIAAFGESVRAYYGGRIAYISTETELSFDGGSRPLGFDSQGEKIERDGFLLAPTIGLEYNFTPRFSIAGEASLEYLDLDGDDSAVEALDTDTNVVVRFRF